MSTVKGVKAIAGLFPLDTSIPTLVMLNLIGIQFGSLRKSQCGF
jgi:hypothetical protein